MRRRVRLVLAALPAVGLLLALARWWTMERALDEFTARCQQAGLTVAFEVRRRNWMAVELSGFTLGAPPSARVEVKAATLHLPLFGTPNLELGTSQLRLAGAPEQLHTLFTLLSESPDTPLTSSPLEIAYRDPSVGELVLQGAHARRDESRFIVSARHLEANDKHFTDVRLVIARPKSVLLLSLDDKHGHPAPFELRYVPAHPELGEWVLTVPSQPAPAFFERLGVQAPLVGPSSRISGLVSMFSPRDGETEARGELRVVWDDWVLPDWAEANTLLGSSGALSARLSRGEKGNLQLDRVEVSAALFSLTGSGSLRWGNPAELRLDAAGSLSCLALSEQLPPSTYRTRVRAFLAASTPAERRVRHSETVTLRTRFVMQDGQNSQLSASFWLSAGCGLTALTSDMGS